MSEQDIAGGDESGDEDGTRKVTVKEPARDIWDYISILGRPISAFFTALAVAAIGLIGQCALKDREEAITDRQSLREEQVTLRTAREQDIRLYTELLSRREEAESALRKDMFRTILGEFFEKPQSDAESDLASIDGRLLKLELLAINFSDSISLSPVFLSINRETMEARGQGAFWQLERDSLRGRLKSLARRISGAQLAALTLGGKSFEFDVPLDRLADKAEYRWPEHEVEEEINWSGEGDKLSKEAVAELVTQQSEKRSVIVCGKIPRRYSASFSSPNPAHQTVDVALTIHDIATSEATEASVASQTREIEFQLNFFNFPMIDNTRLSQNQRFALVMERFEKDHIAVVGVCFPGTHASQRDKPYLNEVIEQLHDERLDSSARIVPLPDGGGAPAPESDR
jgi:hypothetical protein